MRSTTLDLFFLTTLAAGLVYFSVDAWFGSSGGAMRAPLRAEIRALEQDIQAIEAQQQAIEKKVERLAGPEIDPELLDERLRANLGVLGERDVLLIEPGETR